MTNTETLPLERSGRNSHAGAWERSRAGCWTDQPRPHPWHADITDMACGYDHKLTDSACLHCHRQRPDQPHEQIPAAPGLEPGRGLKPAPTDH
jgi:hypothetical protein